MAALPISNAGESYINNLQVSRNSATKLDIAAGQARDSGNQVDIELSSSVTVDGGVTGANGLDTGSLANNTWYAVYVIGDSFGNKDDAGLISTDASSPSLPFGYDVQRLIGWALTDGSAEFLEFYMYGNGAYRRFWFDVGISELSSGTSTSFSAVDVASSVPPQAVNVMLDAIYTPALAANVAEFRPTGSSATDGIVRIGAGVAAAQRLQVEVPAQLSSGAPSFDYKVVSSDSLDLNVVGFDLYL